LDQKSDAFDVIKLLCGGSSGNLRVLGWLFAFASAATAGAFGEFV